MCFAIICNFSRQIRVICQNCLRKCAAGALFVPFSIAIAHFEISGGPIHFSKGGYVCPSAGRRCPRAAHHLPGGDDADLWSLRTILQSSTTIWFIWENYSMRDHSLIRFEKSTLPHSGMARRPHKALLLSPVDKHRQKNIPHKHRSRILRFQNVQLSIVINRPLTNS